LEIELSGLEIYQKKNTTGNLHSSLSSDMILQLEKGAGGTIVSFPSQTPAKG
jgi:hypothetical protein